MNDWERKEMELQQQENAYLEAYTPFEKFIDNPVTYLIGLGVVELLSMLIGFLIGMML